MDALSHYLIKDDKNLQKKLSCSKQSSQKITKKHASWVHITHFFGVLFFLLLDTPLKAGRTIIFQGSFFLNPPWFDSPKGNNVHHFCQRGRFVFYKTDATFSSVQFWKAKRESVKKGKRWFHPVMMIDIYTNYRKQIICLHFVNLCMLFQTPKILHHKMIV